MGAAVFTEAELRRAYTVAADVGAIVEINPRQGTIRLIPSKPLDDETETPQDLPKRYNGG